METPRNIAKLGLDSKTTIYSTLEKTLDLYSNRKQSILHYGCLHSLTKDMTHNVNV